mgnify:CR=1 FL=1
MKSFFQKLLALFFKSEPKPEPVRKVAICVGHSRINDSGAKSVGGVSEWEFNHAVAIFLNEKLIFVGDLVDGYIHGKAKFKINFHTLFFGIKNNYILIPGYNNTNPSFGFADEDFDRALYSDGALAAAKWLMKKKPGLYSMRDLLNFS